MCINRNPAMLTMVNDHVTKLGEFHDKRMGIWVQLTFAQLLKQKMGNGVE